MQESSLNGPVWSNVHIPEEPSLEGEIETDVCVIGLGGTGLQTIRRLGEGEKRVVGIDAKRIAGSAAGSNGGFLLAGIADERYDTLVAMLGRNRAREIYGLTVQTIEQMQQEIHDCVRQVGSLRIGDEAEYADCLKEMEALRVDGFEVKTYEGHEGRGLLFPRDAYFHPRERCRQQVLRAKEPQALLFEHTPALGIETGKVTTPTGIIHCKDVVIAVDGRLEQLLPPELKKLVTSFRLQMLGGIIRNDIHFERPVFMRYGKDYALEYEKGKIAIGGGRDVDTEAGNAATFGEPSHEVQAFIEKRMRDIGVEADITHRWAAPVSFTQSGLPIAREIQERVYAIGGYNGTGNIIGPLLGEAIADYILRGDTYVLDLLTKDPIIPRTHIPTP